MNTGGGWVGSLTTILYENGYWLLVNEADVLNLTGIPIQNNQLYLLHSGNNLISYPLPDCGNIDEVLSDDIEDCIYAIAGEGIAAFNTDNGWVGSLTTLCPDEGYWFVNQCDEIECTFDEPASLARNISLIEPPYQYHQSSMQAFYFIEFIEDIALGDWILAYNDGKVIGARQWQGSTLDVPVMGGDGTGYTRGYMEAEAIPEFMLLKNGEHINLEGNISAWTNNGIYLVTSLSQALVLPDIFSLKKAYPNPFNPATTLSFGLPIQDHVILEVYDINGRIITILIDDIVKAGYHTIAWNADSYSSGIYFIRIQAGDYVSIQKLMLVK
jgi:hypothetical protein